MDVPPSPPISEQPISRQSWQGVARVLAISDELGVYTDVDDLLRHAVGLARERLKLERVAIFLRDTKNGLMRGTFGTGASSETTDGRDVRPRGLQRFGVDAERQAHAARSLFWSSPASPG